MTVNIRLKLFFSVFLALLLTIIVLSGLVKVKVEHEFTAYVAAQDKHWLEQLSSALSQYYSTYQRWDKLTDPENWYLYLKATLIEANPTVDHPETRIDRFITRVVLLDAQQKRLMGPQQARLSLERVPIIVNQQTVGYLSSIYQSQLTQKLEHEFNQQIIHQLGWIIAIMLVVALGLAWWLSRHFGIPIQALRKTSQLLTEGQFNSRVTIAGADELAALGKDVNALAERLEANEKARKQWMADIAHELRTPLTILKGEIEALEDGISDPTPHTFHSLNQEVNQLQRLVEDLYQLSLVENGSLSYFLQPTELAPLIEAGMQRYEPSFKKKNLLLIAVTKLPHRVQVQADPQRLQQLINNLFENSLRYTDSPGVLQVSMLVHSHKVEILFDDSAPGVPDEALNHLFDRLYRVESSRNRATGGAGLGLSICRAIVDAHHGQLNAEHSPLGGLRIRLELPLAQE